MSPLPDLIEPYWKIMRSLAPAGLRSSTWKEIVNGRTRSSACWNALGHPVVWEQYRHWPLRSSGAVRLSGPYDFEDNP